MICPECGKEMASGYVRADGIFLSWTDKLSVIHPLKGYEILTDGSIVYGANLQANRCKDCRLIMAKY
ncbi:MAG: PF20097 family protein [Methanomassiliicoccales archaeon]